MITEDYVSFETAKLLIRKGFGFNAEYESYYTLGGVVIYFKDKTQDINIAPRITLQMAMKWLREVYKIHVVIYPYGDYSCDNYQFDVYKEGNLVVSKDDGYITYEEACEAAIRYCLENLI